MGNQRIDYGFFQEWLISINNEIGPTRSTTLRTLDNPSPNDSNAIWLAPNGDDANSGTQTFPVLTISQAVSLLGGAKNTINIFRNGFNGDIIFEEDYRGAAFQIPNNAIIQVELGEIAYWKWRGYVYGDNIKLNGIYITLLEADTGHSGPAKACLNMQYDSEIKYCQIYIPSNFANPFDTQLRYFFSLGFNLTTTSNNIRNCIFRSDLSDTSSDFYNLISNSIKDCIFAGYKGFCYAIAFSKYPFGDLTLNHCVIYNCDRGCKPEGGAISINTIQNSIIAKVGIIDEGPSGGGTIVWQNNLFDSNTYNLFGNESNNIFGFDPLFFNTTEHDFRLFDRRRKAPDSLNYFPISSKGVYDSEIGQEPSDDGRDLGPYDVSYTLLSSGVYSFEFCNEYWSDDVVIKRDLINYQNFNDVRGNYHRNWDDDRRLITFSARNTDYIGTIDSYKFQDLLINRGAKRWYPNGNDGLWQDYGNLVFNDDGSFEITLDNLSFINNSYNGYICKVSPSGTLTPEAYLRVRNSSSGVLILEDHRETQSSLVSSGYMHIDCQYLPIELDMDCVDMIFENWNPSMNPLVPDSDEPENYEGHIRQLIVHEVEDDI